MAEGKRVKKLRKAVNAYLLAQNSGGYDDGPHSPAGKERCEDARRHLAHVVYELNERAGGKE